MSRLACLLALACALPARSEEDAALAAFRAAAAALEADVQSLQDDVWALNGRAERDLAALFPPGDPIAPLRRRRTELAGRHAELAQAARAQAGRDREADRSYDLAGWRLTDQIGARLDGLWRVRAFRARYSGLFSGIAGLRGRLGELEWETAEAGELGEADRLALAARLSALGAEGADLWRSYAEMSLEIDRLEAEGARPQPPFVLFRDRYRDLANPAAEELAALRDRLLALRGALGMDLAARRGGFDGTGLRDLAQLPRLPRLTEEAASLNGPLGFAVLDGVDAVAAWAAPLTGARALPEAARLRRAAGTRTFGNPVGAAPLLHHQRGGTCGIVCQQQVLMAAGAVPEGSRGRALEDALVERAYEAGYFGRPGEPRDRDGDGTPHGHVGSLLTEHGIPYRTHRTVQASVIDAALRDGRYVIAGVHASELWTDGRVVEERHGPEESVRAQTDHVVLITGGAEDSRGRVTLYYVNDPGSGRRAVPVRPEVLLSAMRRSGSVYLEIR